MAPGGITFSGNQSNFEGPMEVVGSGDAILDFLRRQDSFAPAMAVYAPGKNVPFCPSFVRQQQDHWRREIARAEVVFVIGLRVIEEDDHIWGALRTVPARLEYVGGEPDEFLGWVSRHAREKANVLAGTFEEALPLIAKQLA